MKIEDITHVPTLLNILHDQLVLFFDVLMDYLPSEQPKLLVMQLFVKDTVPMTDVIQYIVKNLVPLEERVQRKEEEYFMNHAVLFEGLEDHATTVNHFKKLWEDNKEPEEREAIWKWLTFFIRLGKQYQQVS